MEIWMNYCTKRHVSNLGRFMDIKTGEIVLPTVRKDGYLLIKGKLVHRIVAKAFIPNPNNLPQVNHKHGIKSDNRASELEWCSGSFNTKHSYVNKLQIAPKGEKSVHAKLTNEQALLIRSLKGKIKSVEIAKMFNISTAAVSLILNNKRYNI